MFRFHRVLIGYAVAIPLALILGYLVATPDRASVVVVGMVLFFLALPLVIKWNHGLLIFFWNSAFIVGFLPGQLQLWLIFAGVAFGMGVVHHVMGHQRFLRAPELTKPILFLVTVILITAKNRGGIGVQALGNSSFGGKHYVYVLGAIVGYFALISQPISIAKASRTVKWFFLSELSYGLSNLLYFFGSGFFILYLFISPDFVYGQAQADWGQDIVKRFGGLGPSAIGLMSFILARWGIRGIFEWNKPWRLLLLFAALMAGFCSGFRSEIAFLGLLLVVQFTVEGLWKTRFLPALALLGVLCLTPILLFADKLPAAVQRSLAFLPVHIDPNVREEAVNSTLWRIEMWHVVWLDVPKYFWIGKGYAIDPIDMYLTDEASKRGELSSYEGSIVAGDYHSGPLSVLMPFGIFGSLAFLWLLGAGVKVLYCNRRYGDPRLKLINNLFLSYFLTECVIFFFVFGAFNSQLSVFLGILGLSISLNGGVCRKKAPKAVSTPAPASATLVPA